VGGKKERKSYSKIHFFFRQKERGGRKGEKENEKLQIRKRGKVLSILVRGEKRGS